MAVRLTADLCAQAIVASCGVYGSDPLKVLSAKTNGRAALVPAAIAVQKVTGVGRDVIIRVFGVANTSLDRHEKDATHKSLSAQSAAWSAMDVPEDHDTPDPVPPLAPIVRRPAAAIAPVVAKPAVDHTAAIKAALEKRREKGFPVVGVEADKARLKAGRGLCHWPLGAPAGAQNDPACHDDVVPGRLFCADHCRAVGQKDTPVVLDAPVLPASYRDPRAANAVGRKAAS
jgi:hypothetical protein